MRIWLFESEPKMFKLKIQFQVCNHIQNGKNIKYRLCNKRLNIITFTYLTEEGQNLNDIVLQTFAKLHLTFNLNISALLANTMHTL